VKVNYFSKIDAENLIKNPMLLVENRFEPSKGLIDSDFHDLIKIFNSNEGNFRILAYYK
jgi:hypothetical protein